MMLFNILSLAAIVSLAFAQDGGLAGVLSGNSNLSQLNDLLKAYPDLVTSLTSAKNITLLAPNNAALGTLLNSTAGKALASDPAAVQALLTYHVLKGVIPASAITNTSTFVPTLLEDPKYSNVTGGQQVQAIKGNSGVHIYSGLLQNSTVTQADQNFTGGTVHVIDRVLLIPRSASSTLVTAGLSSLYGALTAANLLGAVDSLKDVTIFAPNNVAFQRIGSALPNLTTEQVTSILTYHVVNGTSPSYSTTLKNNTKLRTLQGTELNVRVVNGSVFVNGAMVTTPDVLVAGGVVHVIDNVLNPGNATATASGPAFAGASSASSPVFTSGVPSATESIAGGGAASATATPSSSSSKAGAAAPVRTGAIGAAALFGAGAVFANL